MFRKILLVSLALLIIIQFIHPKKNKSEGLQANYVGTAYSVPDDVKTIMAKACNDCHSNNTIYPWYSKIQPVHWWLNNHIADGKEHMNYDEFTNKPLRAQYHKMEETIDMIKKGEMPLDNYTWLHTDAKLMDAEKNKIINWATSIMEDLKSKYPMDSLIRKKK